MNAIRIGDACARCPVRFGSLWRCLDGLPDKRLGLNLKYPMGDIGMAAFATFFMGSPSFLAHQRRFEEGNGRSNWRTLFGISDLPSDNHMRDMLDPVAPDLKKAPAAPDLIRPNRPLAQLVTAAVSARSSHFYISEYRR